MRGKDNPKPPSGSPPCTMTVLGATKGGAHAVHGLPHGPSGHSSVHFSHHLLHLRKLFEELVDLLDLGPGTPGDAFASASVEDFGLAALQGGHGLDDGFGLFEHFIRKIHVLDGFANPWNHPKKVFHIPHFF